MKNIWFLKYSEENPEIILSTDEKGTIYFINSLTCLRDSEKIVTQTINPMKTLSFNNSPIFDADWNNGSKRILTAYGDCSCCLIDVETSAILLKEAPHRNSVRVIKSCP